MSKNFEVLRRAEQEGKDPHFRQTPLSIFDHQQTADAVCNIDFAQEIVSCESPIRKVSPAQREEIRKLVNRLFIVPAMDAPRVVVFAGIDDDNGSGTIASCAAQILSSQTARMVCLVDASCHVPTIHKQFGIAPEPGLVNAAQTAESVFPFLQRVGDRLWVLPTGGNILQQPSAESMMAVLSELRARFDFVLLHVAPLALDDDALLTGELWDGVALVLEANVTRRAAAQAVKFMLEAANVRVLGAVLNNRRFPIPQPLYARL